MTKKHYEAIARILNDYCGLNSYEANEWTQREYSTGENIAEELADYFATDNKNFNRDMFLTACGIEKSQT